MTDNDFMELVADELHVCITAEQVPLYKKGILEIAKNINAGKYGKEKAFIKKIVLEHFDCKDCKKFGMFEDCHYVKEKTCQRILSDWCNNVIGW